jgi:Zn-dependent protease with chaperone function
MERSAPGQSSVPGAWFDGKRSVPQPVMLALKAAAGGSRLEVRPVSADAPAMEFGEDEVGWPQRWHASRTPDRVVIDLRDRGSVEVADVAAWQAASEAAGVRTTLAERMQTRWRVFAAVLLLSVAGLFAFYRWGTPWAATQVTRQVPLEWEVALSQRALRDLDDRLLKPSKLPVARQAQLRERFGVLARQADAAMQRYRGYAPRYSLLFRAGLGANAFALPGGTIVMTDGLVEKAAKQGVGDDALVGVLAHEMGHVVHRHTTRMVVEQAVLNVGLGLALGDVSSLVSIGGSVLTGLAYRRGHEAEADCFASLLMRKAGVPVGPMADLLLGMEPGGATKWDLLSSHPATAERARQIKEGRAQSC